MIEVTDEMRDIFDNELWDVSFNHQLWKTQRDKVIKRIIELHEQSKPKPEPYGYVNGISSTDLWFPQDLSDSAKNSDRWTPLYTTPPTREPLSVAELDELWKASYKEHDDGEKVLQNRKRRLKRFARAIEKAHGIGN